LITVLQTGVQRSDQPGAKAWGRTTMRSTLASVSLFTFTPSLQITMTKKAINANFEDNKKT
jgi:hypothetical protein